jgi:hypothetical protein
VIGLAGTNLSVAYFNSSVPCNMFAPDPLLIGYVDAKLFP